MRGNQSEAQFGLIIKQRLTFNVKMGKATLAIIFGMLSIIAQLQVNLASNCTNARQNITPEKCCDFPRYFNEAAIEHCLPSVNDGPQCVYECIYAATELCRWRRCDVRKADDYVEWVKLENTDFIAVYKQAYRECMKEVNEMDENRFKAEKCDPKPQLIENCVLKKMFTLCPEKYYHTEIAECVQEREYLNNCLES